MNKHPEFLLNKIKSPKDLKKLDLKELEQLASEIRTLILEKDAAKGGHLGPNRFYGGWYHHAQTKYK